MRDEIEKRLLTELPDDAGGLDANQREAKIAKLRTELLTLERHEEAILVAIEADGSTVSRRANADPRAIMEIA